MGHRAPFLSSLLIAVTLAAAVPSKAEELDSSVYVTVDRTKVFRIDSPASTVIVGNPLIADVSMHDRNTVVVTGKNYGTTNLVILDENNEPIIDELLTVQSGQDDTVTVTRNTVRQTYSCAPACNPTLRVGDGKDYFDSLMTQAGSLNQLSVTAAGGSASGIGAN